VIALGEPSWKINVDGQWDVVPIVVAIVALVLLKVLLGLRLTPIVVIAVVLAAPLYRAVADAAGFTRTVSVTLAFLGLAALAIRRGRPRPPGTLGHV
jgi:hypothetical protein